MSQMPTCPGSPARQTDGPKSLTDSPTNVSDGVSDGPSGRAVMTTASLPPTSRVLDGRKTRILHRPDNFFLTIWRADTSARVLSRLCVPIDAPDQDSVPGRLITRRVAAYPLSSASAHVGDECWDRMEVRVEREAPYRVVHMTLDVGMTTQDDEETVRTMELTFQKENLWTLSLRPRCPCCSTTVIEVVASIKRTDETPETEGSSTWRKRACKSRSERLTHLLKRDADETLETDLFV